MHYPELNSRIELFLALFEIIALGDAAVTFQILRDEFVSDLRMIVTVA